MAIRRNLALGIGLGLTTCVAIALGIASWVWLPANARALAHEGSQIQARIVNLETTLTAQQQAVKDNPIKTLTPLTPATQLPGQAGDLLARIRVAGGTRISYKLAAEKPVNAHIQRPVRVEFSADVNTVGKVFNQLQNRRPGLTLDAVSLAPGHAGEIDVKLSLTMMGTPNE